MNSTETCLPGGGRGSSWRKPYCSELEIAKPGADFENIKRIRYYSWNNSMLLSWPYR